ncbi:glycosyl transferase [Bacteroidia bacterium]|nr:glycosyl transferase [Bacteroidia bacterium]
MVSVIIPLYNKEEYIRNTLLSVLNQSYQYFEVIIVNDGSTDNSIENIQDIQDRRIRIIHQQNGGRSLARNNGIKESKYKFVAFLDADDQWNEDFLFNMMDLIDQYSMYEVFISNYSFYSQGKYHIALKNKYFSQSKIIDNYFYRSITTPLVTSNTIVIKKGVFNDVGFFNETLSMGEDLDMWFRIMLKYQLVYSPYIGATYNLDAVNRTMTYTHYDGNKEFIKSLQNYYSIKGVDYFIKKYIEELAIRDIMLLSQNVPSVEILNIITFYNQKKMFSFLPRCFRLIYFSPFLIRLAHRMNIILYSIVTVGMKKSSHYNLL